MSAIRVLIGDIPPLLESMLAEMVQTDRNMVLFDPMAPDPGLGTGVEIEGINIVRMSTDRYNSTTTTVSDIAQLGASRIPAPDCVATQIVIIHREQRDLADVRAGRDYVDG